MFWGFGLGFWFGVWVWALGFGFGFGAWGLLSTCYLHSTIYSCSTFAKLMVESS